MVVYDYIGLLCSNGSFFLIISKHTISFAWHEYNITMQFSRLSQHMWPYYGQCQVQMTDITMVVE